MSSIRHQLTQALSVRTTGEGKGFSADFSLKPDFIGFQGHFPGSPVLPGICIIIACLAAAEQVLNDPLEMQRLKSVKFFSPVKPDQKVCINGVFSRQSATDELKINADFTSESHKVARLILFTRRRAERCGGQNSS